MKLSDLTIVVCCNKKDFFLAKICIASIRYFYPKINIELVKDAGNGRFNTNDLEKYFNVRVTDLGIPKMGWSGAKFHYLYKNSKGKKVLILDADIVFTGPFLERLLPVIESNDYVVSVEEQADPNANWVKEIYFDIDVIKSAYPAYVYPGFFFNAGQIFLTVGSIDEDVLNKFFNKNVFPFWINQRVFPLVDQSVYNYLLPTLQRKNKITLGTEKFMLWGNCKEVLEISLNSVKGKTLELGLIHWAGCTRNEYLAKMVRSDILIFFEKKYYSKLPGGILKRFFKNTIAISYYTGKNIYKSLLKIIVGMLKMTSKSLVRIKFLKKLPNTWPNV